MFPSILNVETRDGGLYLEFDANLEAMLAGVDLQGLDDTNDAENASDYDELRALDPQALVARLNAGVDNITGNIRVLADGTRLDLLFSGQEVFDPGNVEVARQTRLIYTASLPDGARMLQVGWAAEYGTLVVRQNGPEEPYTGTIRGGELSPEFPIAGGSQMSGWGVFGQYIPIGFDHILPKGLDHILFVLGLFLLAARLRPLLWQVTAFTAAHTVTLALGALGWVTVPGSIVEPLIAASICYVAIENVFTDHMNPWRPFIVFGFGLLHGLGFASVLEEFGLPEDHFIPALLGFNVGVELGQLTVIAIAFLLVGAWFRNRDWYRRAISIPASLVIAAIGAWWVVERTLL